MHRLNDTYVQRSFVVTQENSMEQLELQQFQILAWPEGDNPPSLPGLLEVLEDPEVQQPLLVHSRTGIGRTGVIICIHCALKCISASGKLDLPGLVRHMRQQRGGMIENFEQYKTCIQAVLRYLQHVTGFTSMRIEDGAAGAASLPQLDIIHPRTHTVAAHPLVTNVAKQKVSRTYSDPTLNGSPQTKRRMFLQDMIPPPPTQPPPYTDDDAARAPTSPQVPVSPPPPISPPDNDNFKSTTNSPTTSSASPMQFKVESTTAPTTDTSTTTTTSSSTRRPSIILHDGENTEVLFEPDSAVLQRKTMRASQHDATVTQLQDQLQQEPIEQPQFPPQETEENDLFTKTFGRTTSTTMTTNTMATNTISTTTTTTTTTSSSSVATTKEVNTTVENSQPLEEVVKSTTKLPTETKDSRQPEHRQETYDTSPEPRRKPDPTVEVDDKPQDEDPVKQVVTDSPPVTHTTTKLTNHQQTMRTPTSVRETTKMFGGAKSHSSTYSHLPKVKNSISELAKVFGGTVTATTDQSKSFSHTEREPKRSVSLITKRFDSTKLPSIPPKPPKPIMEDQTLTFTFDKVEGEFSEMKLNRSVEKLDQPVDREEPEQPQTFTGKTDTPLSRIPTKQKASDTPEFRPINKPPKQPEPKQPAQRAIKKLDMSKFAMFGKSVND